jgi:hypothetical protein
VTMATLFFRRKVDSSPFSSWRQITSRRRKF